MVNSNFGSQLLATLRTFSSWWRRELASLVPVAWRHWYFGRGHILLVDLRDERFLVSRPGKSGLETLASVDLQLLAADQRRQAVAQALGQANGGKSFLVYLCLPAERALRKTLRLPLAVEENLRQTLAFELDRQTPFKAEQVYFDSIVRERRPAEQQLRAELIVLPKAAVDQPVSQAAALGLALNGAVLASDLLEFGARSPNFLAATLPSPRFRQRLWINVALLLLALLLAASALALPVWQKRHTAMTLTRLSLAAKGAAQQTQLLRDQMEALANEYKFAVDPKNALPSTFLLVNQLSKLLPDDTYVSNLEVTGKDVQIQGETGSSSKLIELMEGSGFLTEASHKSLLTQIPGTSVERFHIAAKTRPFLEQSGQKPYATSATGAATSGAPPAPPAAAVARAAPPPVDPHK
jgi:general secretion pathway protein L